ncbi:MAG TPA: flagellar hook-associated protein FlgL [Calidithermus sp.]|nr:flagellar hook-associated protein FlgL [Calidithermus sp.]
MRITTSMLFTQGLAGLQAALERLARAQRQAATGARLAAASDDPEAASRATRATARLAALEQWQRQAADAADLLTMADDTLGRVADVVGRAHELALSGANDTQGPVQRQAMATEVDVLLETVVAAINERLDRRQVFGGRQSTTPPLTVTRDAQGRLTAAAWAPDVTGPISIQVDDATTVDLAVPGPEAFGADTAPDFLPAVLMRLRDALAADDAAAVRALLPELQTATDRLNVARIEVGARLGRLDGLRQNLADRTTDAESFRSSLLDADLARAAIDVTQGQLAYQAALGALRATQGLGLVDFLR